MIFLKSIQVVLTVMIHPRENLSAIESIEATIEIIDVKMGKEPGCLTVGKTPLERVQKLLSKLDSIGLSREQGLLF